MFRFLVFAVTLSPEKSVSIRHPQQASHYVEAADYNAAIEQAANHIVLHIGEQLAIVKLGRILNAEAGDTLNLGQSA